MQLDATLLAQLTYARRIAREHGLKLWDKLPEYAREHWTGIMGDVLAVLEEMRAEEVKV